MPRFEGFASSRVRLLVVPGLHDSGPTHWQSWLQAHHRGAVRVEQDDWATPDLERWSERIRRTLERHEGTTWVAAAHSFGCLALAHYLGTGGRGIASALLVAPADPGKFRVGPRLPQQGLPVPSILIGSETDPWMRLDSAREWARRWRSQFINLGDVGHINAEAGFGPLPQAKTLVTLLMQRAERGRRIERAHALELSFAI